MNRVLLASLLTSVTFLSGCVSNPTASDLNSADYGPEPSKELYEGKIKNHQETNLKDPGSARYKFAAPHKGWCKFNGKVNYGWIVDYTVNAKNSYGGYTGAKPQFALLNNTTAYHPDYFMRDACGSS